MGGKGEEREKITRRFGFVISKFVERNCFQRNSIVTVIVIKVWLFSFFSLDTRDYCVAADRDSRRHVVCDTHVRIARCCVGRKSRAFFGGRSYFVWIIIRDARGDLLYSGRAEGSFVSLSSPLLLQFFFAGDVKTSISSGAYE